MSIVIEIPPGMKAAELERLLTSGALGAEKRCSAVRAADAYYDTAIAREPLGAGAPVDRTLGIGRLTATRAGKAALELGWDDCAGESSMLAAYAEHLVHLRAIECDLLAGDLERLSPERGFVEIERSLASRDGSDLALQAIRATDARRVVQNDMNEKQRAAWSALADGCACPACASFLWTESEVDALAIRIEAREAGAILDVGRCMTATPRLYRATVGAGARWRTMFDYATLGRFWKFWRRHRTAAALEAAAGLLGHPDVDVRASALCVTIMAEEESAALERIRAALMSEPVLARAAMEGWLHRAHVLGPSIVQLSELLASRLAATMVEALTDTQDGELAYELINALSSYPRAVPSAEWALFKKAVAPWTKHPKTERLATYARKLRQPK